MKQTDTNIKCLVKNYAILEKAIQDRICLISESYCKNCLTKCCKEVMCREVIESSFLLLISKANPLKYDWHSGFLGPYGCKLKTGRPPVCYEFFCTKISNDPVFQSSNIQQLIRQFIAIGNRAHGNTHLICIEDLSNLSKHKIAKMNDNIVRLIGELNENK